jgi:hypothetical protein
VSHLDKDYFHVAVFNSTDFFTTRILAEHTTLDGDAFATLTSATCNGKCVFI